MKDFLDTKEKAEEALATLKTGVETPFWNLMKKVLAGNVEALTERILVGRNFNDEEATKDEMDRLRDKREVYVEVKDTPEKMIKNLESTGEAEVSDDPYQTRQKLEEERAKTP